MEKELLGKGRFGEVYKVTKDDEAIALKEIIIEAKNKEKALILGLDSTEELEEKTQEVMKEISFLNDLKGDSHIVNYIDYFVDKTEDQYTLSIEMELLKQLDSIHDGILDEKDIKALLDDMLDALAVLEAHHIVHGDIKPSNIMVDDYGNYKLTDFGISKVLGQKLVGYTKAYAPKEVLEEGRYTSSSDLYSLGLVIYQMFNKNLLPFMKDKDDLDSIHNRFKEELPRPEGMDNDFYEFLKTALNNNPEERYFSAKAMKNTLDYLYKENHIPAITISVTELLLIVSKLSITNIKGMEVKVLSEAIKTTAKAATGSAVKKGIITKIASLPVLTKAGITAALVVSGAGYYKYKDYQNSLYEENIQIAEEHMAKKEYDPALEYLNKARDINGKRYEAYEDMAKVYIDQDEGQKALDTLATANSKLNDNNYKKVKKYEEPAYYNVYSKIINKTEKKYGSINKACFKNYNNLIGVYFLALVDYNGDGINELTMFCRKNSKSASHAIIYTYQPKDSKCTQIFDASRKKLYEGSVALTDDLTPNYLLLVNKSGLCKYTYDGSNFQLEKWKSSNTLLKEGEKLEFLSNYHDNIKLYPTYELSDDDDEENITQPTINTVSEIKDTLLKSKDSIEK